MLDISKPICSYHASFENNMFHSSTIHNQCCSAKDPSMQIMSYVQLPNKRLQSDTLFSFVLLSPVTTTPPTTSKSSTMTWNSPFDAVSYASPRHPTTTLTSLKTTKNSHSLASFSTNVRCIKSGRIALSKKTQFGWPTTFNSSNQPSEPFELTT